MSSNRSTGRFWGCREVHSIWIGRKLMTAVDVLRRVVPRRLRYFVQRWVSLRDLKLNHFRRSNPLSSVEEGNENPEGLNIRFGIVRNSAQYHTHFIRACQEIGVPFRVIDLFASDWLERIRASECDVLLVWPDAVLSIWNRMIRDRIRILECELGYPTMPDWSEIWMYEDKRRMAYWLEAQALPHPKTWIFYDRGEADAFAERCRLPVVFKTSFGAASSGVRILRSRRAVSKVIKKSFAGGISPGGLDFRDRQWGSILFQEYLLEVQEWRIVRVGDSFLCRRKERLGDFHSGSGLVGWARPSREVLDLARKITDLGGFRSMALDFFETTDGRLLVNELQAVFGEIRESNLERGAEFRGRWIFDQGTEEWNFETGDFYRNACANLRVLDAMERGLCRTQGASRADGVAP